MSLYATDGKCHNAEPGTYGHECGKPAAWLGTNRDGFTSGFCDDCKRHGHEARAVVTWQPIDAARDELAHDLAAAIAGAGIKQPIHNAAVTDDIEALRRELLGYIAWWNRVALPALDRYGAATGTATDRRADLLAIWNAAQRRRQEAGQ